MNSAEPVSNLTPKRVVLLLTGVEEADFDGFGEAVAAVIDDAEASGLFLERAAVGDIDIKDIATGSASHQALTGHFPNR